MRNMKILVLGSGGREHVFAWKLSNSKHEPKIFVAPGNAGTEQIATNVALNPLDFQSVGDFCLQNQIDILIPGSEEPLVKGIVDYLRERPDTADLFVFGPAANVAMLEGSKDFAKDFMMENRIPTAGYHTFLGHEYEKAVEYVHIHPGPYVLKADGLAAGKGVVITPSSDEAADILKEMMVDRKFGDACDKVVVEDFIPGIEFSVFAICDGKSFKLLPMAKDYKRIGEGDTGLNTGGMGAVSPVPFVDDEVLRKTFENIVNPTFEGFQNRNQNFVGFVFFGLINTPKSPMVIEYNVRMGDPETEVIFPRIKNDMVELLQAIREQKLDEVEIEVEDGYCTTVFAVSGGYPENYGKGIEISIPTMDKGTLFHAGTKKENGKLVTSGGRVIASTAIGDTLNNALKTSYSNIENIQFEGKYYRSDIGQDLLELQNGNSK
jgi:phosphoribosylamine---glycine ligase